MSWREAYIGIPVNKGAFALLSLEQQDIIHAHNAEEAQALATQVTVRSLPVQQEEEKWLEIWQTFKAK